jgi:hypothetical protein
VRERENFIFAIGDICVCENKEFRLFDLFAPVIPHTHTQKTHKPTHYHHFQSYANGHLMLDIANNLSAYLN